MSTATPPLVGGWGGITTTGANHFDPTNPPSEIFPGEQASNTELAAKLTKTRGWNAMRVSLIDPALGGDATTFSPTGFQRTIQIAQFFDLWILADYHRYTDQHDNEAAWIAFWRDQVVIPFGPTYAKFIWEPINEPVDISVIDLAVHYNNWISAVRATGDAHWIVVSINNYQDMTDPNFGNFFPQVNDPLNRVMYTFHDYFFYVYHQLNWSIAGAVAFADLFNAKITEVINRYGRPVIITEFGADCIDSGPPPPDLVISGSANYSPESVAFVNRLIYNLDHRIPRVGYFLWTAGDWTDTPGAGATGALNIWGQQVQFTGFEGGAPPPIDPTILIAAGLAAVGTAGIAYAMTRKKKGK